jgi:hypothetical protein
MKNVNYFRKLVFLFNLRRYTLTPIMGNGRAPLQPLEVGDAAQRIAFLALTARPASP